MTMKEAEAAEAEAEEEAEEEEEAAAEAEAVPSPPSPPSLHPLRSGSARKQDITEDISVTSCGSRECGKGSAPPPHPPVTSP